MAGLKGAEDRAASPANTALQANTTLLGNTTRLAVLAFLSACREAQFSAVQEHCAVSAPTLSKAVSALESASYVKVRKGYIGKYPHTWLAATKHGRAALDDYLSALQLLVSSARQAAQESERTTGSV
ncbi:MAG TPA: transcriptional regulator [Acidimicrobiales bacterium]|nr:transcriptional regulator [Acidimicrobiales bacterium]